MQVSNASLDFSSASSRSAAVGSAHGKRQGTLDSIEILQGQKSITIQHNGALYRLQATKLGKLILTK